MSQGNQCITILKKQKCHFFFHKIREQEGRTSLTWGVGTNRRGEDVGIGYRRVTMVQTLCTHVCKWKDENC
jgi:hypothetical protein